MPYRLILAVQYCWIPRLYAWGSNNIGQLGLGDTASRSSPVAVLGNFKAQAIATNLIGLYAIALGENGNLYAWGNNANGQLGLGDVTPRSSPVAVLGGLKFQSISCGVCSSSNAYANNSLALSTTGTAYGWG